MTSITLKIKNLDKVYIGLEKVGEEIPKVGKRVVKRYMKEAMNRTRDYSTQQPPGSRYIRTGAYFSGFSLEESGGVKTFSYTIFSRRARGVYIGGDSKGLGQAGNTWRWPLLRAEVEQVVSDIIPEFTAQIQSVFKSFGL